MGALIMDRCVFLHVPKTGGTWATDALRRQGIVLAELRAPDGQTHPTLETVRAAVDLLPAIATVRDPVGWLRSFWRFFLARDWRPSGHEMFEPLLAMATPSFPEFAQRYLSRRPGYVSELLAMFADGADYVCRQETLLEDLCAALRECGQEHLPEVMRRTPRANVSRLFEAGCSSELEAEIREADSWLVERCRRAA